VDKIGEGDPGENKPSAAGTTQMNNLFTALH